MSAAPLVSIVMPTHNRGARLQPALEALARQDWPAYDLEVILVADGCTDGTAGVFASWRPPFDARLMEQPAGGAAAARNRGAAAARGRYLVFLDDDILASAGLVRAHVEAHGGAGGQVAIGYLPAQVGGADFFSIALRGWWDAMFQAMWTPGHRFTFRDLLSGNFSIERELFESIGGFESGLYCHEDYELGIRLLDAGVQFRFAPRALGVHDERTGLLRSMQRKFDEGKADVWLLARYPHLASVLPMRYMNIGLRRQRRLQRLALSSAPAGERATWVLHQRLRLYERLRLRYRWRDTIENLFLYAYWRGVAAAGGPPSTLPASTLATPSLADITEIDLAYGLEAAERRLDDERPAAARLRHGASLVGQVDAVPGAERLRGEHLRPLLAERFIDPYARALALAGDFPPIVDAARVAAAFPAPSLAGVPIRHANAAS